MEECHRKIILDNIEDLIKYTNYEKLMKACVEQHILSPVMMSIIEETTDAKAKHKQLFIKLTKRGPTAYNGLVHILEKLQHLQAVKILRSGEYGRDEFKSLRQLNGALSNGNGNSNNNSNNININHNYNNKNNININTNNNSNTSNISSNNNNVISNNSNSNSNSNNNFIVREINDNGARIHGQNYNTDGGITSRLPVIDIDDDTKLEVFTGKVNCSFEVKKTKEIRYDGKIPTYPMESKHRGILFLVNIVDFISEQRKGSNYDADALIHLFREMGFYVFYYENLRQDKFHKLLDALLESKYAQLSDSFVMCIMSHGSLKKGVERVEFYGGSVEDLSNIIDKFRNHVCLNLVSKPKIFIFPFCRGEISDRGMMNFPERSQKHRIETDHIKDVKMKTNIPTYNDILICYASVPGYKTHRDPDEGSWYIQMFCKVFAEYAHNTHIEDLLKIVGEETGQIRTEDYKLQTSSNVMYGFYKKLFFNPGYFKN